MEKLFVCKVLYPSFSPIHENSPNNLAFLKQFVFVPTGSTTSALIAIIQSITLRLLTQPFMRMISLDVAKAFDTVRHSELVSKASTIIIEDQA